MPNHNYLHIHNDVIPALLEAGVTRGDLDKMLVDIPRPHFNSVANRFARRS